MRELSLFSGGGGGCLSSLILKHNGFPDWRTVGYVEREDYPQRILAQRIKDGWLDEAPIFSDIRTFISEGYASRYRGVADIVTGGFPCQGHSVAGVRKADKDARDLWPETCEVIRQVRPRLAFLENVPGLLSSKHDVYGTFHGAILGDLASIGYDARWIVLGADDVGAPHRRKRLWIMAYAKCDGSLAAEGSGDAAGATGKSASGSQQGSESEGDGGASSNVADSEQQGLEGYSGHGAGIDQQGRIEAESNRPAGESSLFDSDRPGREHDGEGDARERFEGQGERVCAATSGSMWWNVEPSIRRVADGVPSRVDRIKALGNGQVPLCAAVAFTTLYRDIMKV